MGEEVRNLEGVSKKNADAKHDRHHLDLPVFEVLHPLVGTILTHSYLGHFEEHRIYTGSAPDQQVVIGERESKRLRFVGHYV